MKAKEELYNELYDRADKLFKKYDLCGIRDGVCRCGKFGECSCLCYVPGSYRCIYFADSGCTVRMLGCKLRYCSTIRKDGRFKNVLKEIDKLKSIAERCGLLDKDTQEKLSFNAEIINKEVREEA